MKKLLLLLGIIGILTFSNQAQAAIIVDTGPGASGLGGGWVIDGSNHQWLAARFSITQGYSLTDIYGWMGLSGSSGSPTISIYGDAGETPNTADQKFSQSFSITNSAVDWRGLSGLSWNLSSGNYWITFEPGPTPVTAYMPGPSTSPLGDEANFVSGIWLPNDDLNLGIQILGNPIAATPEPASMTLLGLGLFGLMGFKKKIS